MWYCYYVSYRKMLQCPHSRVSTARLNTQNQHNESTPSNVTVAQRFLIRTITKSKTRRSWPDRCTWLFSRKDFEEHTKSFSWNESITVEWASFQKCLRDAKYVTIQSVVRFTDDESTMTNTFQCLHRLWTKNEIVLQRCIVFSGNEIRPIFSNDVHRSKNWLACFSKQDIFRNPQYYFQT